MILTDASNYFYIHNPDVVNVAECLEVLLMLVYGPHTVCP